MLDKQYQNILSSPNLYDNLHKEEFHISRTFSLSIKLPSLIRFSCALAAENEKRGFKTSTKYYYQEKKYNNVFHFI